MKHRSKLIALTALLVASGCTDTPELQLRRLVDSRVAAGRAGGVEYLCRPTLQVHIPSINPDSALVIIEDSGKGDGSGPYQGFRTFELHYAFENGQWRFRSGNVRGNYEEILHEPFPAELLRYFADRPKSAR